MVNDQERKIEYYTDLTVYNARKGAQTYRRKHQVSKIVVHPKYDGDAKSGFDIAICTLGQDLGSKNYTTKYYSTKELEHDVVLDYVDPMNMVKGTQLNIAGFPGDKCGRLHQHRG